MTPIASYDSDILPEELINIISYLVCGLEAGQKKNESNHVSCYLPLP